MAQPTYTNGPETFTVSPPYWTNTGPLKDGAEYWIRLKNGDGVAWLAKYSGDLRRFELVGKLTARGDAEIGQVQDWHEREPTTIL